MLDDDYIDGVASNLAGAIKIIDSTENWQGTGKTFEYYRRYLEQE